MHSEARVSRVRFRSFLRPRLVFMTIVSPRSSYHITVCCGLPLAFTVANTAKRSSSRNVRTSSLSCKCTKTPSQSIADAAVYSAPSSTDEHRDLDILAPRHLPLTRPEELNAVRFTGSRPRAVDCRARRGDIVGAGLGVRQPRSGHQR